MQLLLTEAKNAMSEAVKSADMQNAKWLVNKLSWQVEYLTLALTLRKAQNSNNSSQVNIIRREIAQLVTSHTNDGTTLERGYGYQSAQEPD